MKKIVLLLFICVIGMARMVAAQQPITLSIVSTQDDNTEKIKGVPSTYTVVYFAKDVTSNKNSTTYYIVIRPIESFDYKTFKLFSGTANTILEIQNSTTTRDDDTLIVKNNSMRIVVSFSRFEANVTMNGNTIDMQKIPINN